MNSEWSKVRDCSNISLHLFGDFWPLPHLTPYLQQATPCKLTLKPFSLYIGTCIFNIVKKKVFSIGNTLFLYKGKALLSPFSAHQGKQPNQGKQPMLFTLDCLIATVTPFVPYHIPMNYKKKIHLIFCIHKSYITGWKKNTILFTICRCVVLNRSFPFSAFASSLKGATPLVNTSAIWFSVLNENFRIQGGEKQ